MENREKTVKLLELFLSHKKVDGVCGYIVDPDVEGSIQVIVVLDIDYIQEFKTITSFMAKMIREGVKQEIKKWVGFDVYVGSIAKKCEENINESISTYLRRRFSFEHIKQDMDNLVDYELNPCDFNNIGDFVAEACDILTYNYLEDLQVSSKDKDGFYISLVDLFGKYLVNVYKERCVKGLRESKKTYMVTESQYNLIVESQKHEQFFQELIDSNLEIIRKECDYGSDVYEENSFSDTCRQLEGISKIKVTDAEWVTGKGYVGRGVKEMSIKIMVYYSSIQQYGNFDADDITYDLERMIRKSTGMLLTLNYESTNTNTSFEW
jgi:hypothetical protein